jgi:hypothetical protein
MGEGSPWLSALQTYVAAKPVVVLRLNAFEWEALRDSRRGIGEFTKAYHHEVFEPIRAPTLCLLLAEVQDTHYAYLGMIGGREAITTLESRVKIKRVVGILPVRPGELAQLMEDEADRKSLHEMLSIREGVTVLSPKLSAQLVFRLSSIKKNAESLRSLASALEIPRQIKGNAELQSDAIRLAMKAFGLSGDDRASARSLVDGKDSRLVRIPLIEDGVIEHDARSIPGFRLETSDMTGRAVFVRGNERLEVITANRRDLEHAFGVDLIYLNVPQRNLVMLQYKMLKAPQSKGGDWTFVPDERFDKELQRMRIFAGGHALPAEGYRLNPSVFFLKFVKRDGALCEGGIIMPIDHYEKFVTTPSARGPRGGVRVGYKALQGSYLREQPFLDLFKAGYIGSYADKTDLLITLVNEILSGNKAVVAAVQTVAGGKQQ